MTQFYKTLLILNTGNDADIIKESILHNEKFFDKIIVSDRNSIDSTLDIIKSLKLSKIEIIESGEYHWSNQHKIHLEILEENRSYDFIFILDADEFIKADNLDELIEVPANSAPTVNWQTYIPMREVFDSYIDNFNYRRKQETHPWACHKIIHTKLSGININGNHHLLDNNGNQYPEYKLNSIHLAHFPVRNIEQYNKKVDYFNSTFYELTESFYSKTVKVNNINELINAALNYVNDGKQLGYEDIVYDPIK